MQQALPFLYNRIKYAELGDGGRLVGATGGTGRDPRGIDLR